MADEQPLAGIRVLDLSRVLAGPWCTQMLADFGADVIKVEKPGAGDDSRGWGPPYYSDSNGHRVSAYFCATNRGKKSVELDFEDPAQLEIVRKLASECDVLVENFKVGALGRRGLDYESIFEKNPKVVYCSITGFGQTGPLASRPGYDTIMQGMGGLMSVTGHPDHVPGGGPVKVGVPLTDIMTGVYAVTGILLALRQRDSSGKGQHIDLALLDVQVSSLSVIAANFLASGKVPGRHGNQLSNAAPSDAMVCNDGVVMIMVATNPQFRKLCRCMGLDSLYDDPRFASNELRVIARDELMEILRPVFKTRSRSEWIEQLSALGVPCGPVNDFADVYNDPQVQARGNLVSLSDPQFGDIRVAANPVRLSRTPAQYKPIPTKLGSAVHGDSEWSRIWE